MDCPCRSGLAFAGCCQPRLTGARPAETAEALMRSRYAAFHQRDVDYLVATHHPLTRPEGLLPDLERGIMDPDWLNLRILKTGRGGPRQEDGTVAYVIAVRPEPLAEIVQMHQDAFFARDADGRWAFMDSQNQPPFRPGRNEPCWCGSGKKAKRCHG